MSLQRDLRARTPAIPILRVPHCAHLVDGQTVLQLEELRKPEEYEPVAPTVKQPE